MKRILICILSVFLLTGCGNLLSYEQIEQIKQEAVEEAKEDILEENALDYVRENYTPEEVYPDKVVLPRGKTKPVQSTIHGELPPDSDPSDGYIIINKKSKVFHRSDCPAVKEMKDSNKESTNKVPSQLIEQGYEPCGMEEW